MKMIFVYLYFAAYPNFEKMPPDFHIHNSLLKNYWD